MDHGLTTAGEVLIVLGQPSVESQPGEGTLYNPALGQEDVRAQDRDTKIIEILCSGQWLTSCSVSCTPSANAVSAGHVTLVRPWGGSENP